MQQQLHRTMGDVSGAFADLGTFLPIVLGVLALKTVDPSGLFVGFGLFALAVAAIYRRPIPVQPMKVVGAVVITQQLSAGDIAAAGILISLILIAMTLFGIVSAIAQRIPQSVLAGIQLGIGLALAWTGLKQMMDAWVIGAVALILLAVLQQTRLKSFTVIIVVIAVSLWHIISRDQSLPSLHVDLYLPALVTLTWPDISYAASSIVLPQLAMTLTNAVVLTAAIAANYFPTDGEKISAKRLALSTGGLNLMLTPFGAFPMCHGAGGLVVQHRFGARTGLAPALFGLSCLMLGLFLGPDAATLLSLIPIAALGALLIYAGLQLVSSKSLFESSRGELFVIVTTGMVSLLFNVAVGLIVGLLLDLLARRSIKD
jgi:SulP family sulfate permease